MPCLIFKSGLHVSLIVFNYVNRSGLSFILAMITCIIIFGLFYIGLCGYWVYVVNRLCPRLSVLAVAVAYEISETRLDAIICHIIIKYLCNMHGHTEIWIWGVDRQPSGKDAIGYLRAGKPRRNSNALSCFWREGNEFELRRALSSVWQSILFLGNILYALADVSIEWPHTFYGRIKYR